MNGFDNSFFNKCFCVEIDVMANFAARKNILSIIFAIMAGLQVVQCCFAPNSRIDHRIISNSSFYQECQCPDDEGGLESLNWLDPTGQVIPALGPGTGSNAYSIRFQNTVSLHVKMFTKQMSGVYKCIAKVHGKEYFYKHAITAYDPLTFVNTEQNQFIVKGRNSIINCQPQGEFPLIVRWYRGDDGPLEIVDEEKYSIQGNGLVVKNVEESDSGLYKCIVTVLETGEEVDKFIKVKVFTTPEIEDAVITSSNPITVGDFLKIDCTATGIPKPIINWIKVGNEITKPEEQKSWHEEGNVIIFDKIKANDRGTYICTATNEAGKTEKEFIIEVLVPPKIEDFQNLTAVQGTNTSLACTATGRPAPKLTITRRVGDEDEPLDGTKDVSWIYEQTNETASLLTVMFSLIDKSQDGEYKCNAKNRVDIANKTSHLSVLFMPEFEKSEEIVYGWHGKIVKLSCQHESNPESTVIWRYNKSEIKEDSEDITIYDSFAQHYLNISFENNTHYGVYRCFVRNKLGESVKIIRLVEGFPPTTISNVSVTSIAATSVTFEILGPDEIVGLPIVGYKTEYDELENYNYTDIHKNRTWSVDRPYKIDSLKPGKEYSFKFAAMNEVGTGTWSEFLQVFTPEKSTPEPPIWDTAFLNDAIDITDKLHSHLVSWKTPEVNGDPIDYYVLRYCPLLENVISEEDCKEERLMSVNSIELQDLSPNTTYHVSLIAHNSEGNSDPAETYIQTMSFSEELPTLSAGAIISVAVVIVLIILLTLDLILLFWRRQGIIATICFNKNKKNTQIENGERDKKGLLKDGEQCAGDTLKGDKGHKEFVYNKTTGIITGKHSAV